MKTYQVVVEETLTRTAFYTVLAENEKEARVKAINGDTESEDLDPYSEELANRIVRNIEVEDPHESMGDEYPEKG